MAQVEAFLTVDPMHPLVIDVPAFPSQQHMDPLITITDTDSSYLTNALPKRTVILPDGLVIIYGPPETDDFTGPSLTNAIGQVEIID